MVYSRYFHQLCCGAQLSRMTCRETGLYPTHNLISIYARMEEMRNAFKTLVGNPKRKNHLEYGQGPATGGS
jgi:hypothetical protein